MFKRLASDARDAVEKLLRHSQQKHNTHSLPAVLATDWGYATTHMLEFSEALSGLRKDTAAGPDKAKYSDIKNLSVDDKSDLRTVRRKLRNKTGSRGLVTHSSNQAKTIAS